MTIPERVLLTDVNSNPVGTGAGVGIGVVVSPNPLPTTRIIPNLTRGPINVGAGTTIIIPGVAGKVITLYDCVLSNNGATNGNPSQLQDTSPQLIAYLNNVAGCDNPIRFNGLPLGIGLGVQLVVPAAVGAIGSLLYTQL